MKGNRIAKILGVALTTGLVFALISAVFVTPAAADETEWSKLNTPSHEDGFIVPGSDIYHYDIAEDDGSIIVAVGAINGSDDCEIASLQGLTGSFYADSGTVTIEELTATEAEVSATAYGEACYLGGDFTAILEVSLDGLFGTNDGLADPVVAYAAVCGEITYGKDAVANDDKMTFSGKVYIDSSDSLPPDGDYTFGDDWLCVEDWMVDNTTMGSFIIDSGYFTEPRVWMSDDGGVTWDDITGDVQDASNLPGPFFQFGYGGVAFAPDDPDWLVISGGIFHPDWIGLADFGGLGIATSMVGKGVPATVASKDGADNFSYAGDMEDTSNGTWMGHIYDVDVSIETDDDIHIIAVAGINTPDFASGTLDEFGSVFRLDAGTWLTGNWEDTTDYAGWDNGVANAPTWAVVDGEFSPNFDVDVTYVAATVDHKYRGPGVLGGCGGIPYLQMGLFESGTWNDEAGFSCSEIISCGFPHPWYVDKQQHGLTYKVPSLREELYQRKNGDKFWVEIASAIVEDQSREKCFLETWNDITRDKQFADNLRSYASLVTSTLEGERKRLARELHDETIQSLFCLCTDIGNCIKDGRLPPDIRRELKLILDRTGGVMNSLRSFCHEMRPDIIDRFGLVPSIKLLVEEMKRSNGPTCHFDIIGDIRRLPSDTELAIFRIVQEALSNIRRHANATEVKLSGIFNDSTIQIIVSDNGIGFEVPNEIEALASYGKLGLVGMNERTYLIGGTLSIDSEKDKGTTITVQVPLLRSNTYTLPLSR